MGVGVAVGVGIGLAVAVGVADGRAVGAFVVDEADSGAKVGISEDFPWVMRLHPSVARTSKHSIRTDAIQYRRPIGPNYVPKQVICQRTIRLRQIPVLDQDYAIPVSAHFFTKKTS